MTFKFEVKIKQCFLGRFFKRAYFLPNVSNSLVIGADKGITQ